MSLYALEVYVHVVAAVVLVGYSSFWLVMSMALRREGGDLDTEETLALIGRSRWPPFVVPEGLRVSMVVLGWILILFMVASGALLLHVRGVGPAQLGSGAFWAARFGHVLAVKLGLLGLFVVDQIWLSVRPSPRGTLLGAVLVALIACVSVLL